MKLSDLKEGSYQVEDAPLKLSDLHPDDVQEDTLEPEEQGLLSKAKGVGLKALDTVGRGLDYAGGLTRTGLAEVAGIGKQVAQGKNPLNEKQVVTPDDVTAALKGRAPSSSEYLERLGVGEGPSVDVPALGDMGHLSARGAAGLLADVATDPATTLAKLLPASKGAETLGKDIYKSGFKRVDQILSETDKTPISEVLFDRGVSGKAKNILPELDVASNEYGKARQKLFDEAEKSGVKVDMNKASQGVQKSLAKMKQDPGLAPIANALEDKLELYKKKGLVSLEDASNFKTNIMEGLPDSAFNKSGQLKGSAQKFNKKLGLGIRDEIVNAGNKVKEGFGDQINDINDKWASVITAEKPLQKAARIEANKKGISQLDAALLGTVGGAITSGNPAAAIAGAGAYLGKKGVEHANTLAGRTHLGLLTNKLGQTGLLDVGARRGLINVNQNLQNKDQVTIQGLLNE